MKCGVRRRFLSSHPSPYPTSPPNPPPQGSEFGEWLSSSGIQPGEQLQFKAQGGEVLIRRGPMVPEVSAAVTAGGKAAGGQLRGVV